MMEGQTQIPGTETVEVLDVSLQPSNGPAPRVVSSGPAPVTSVSQWAGRKRHTVTLLSGAVVEIEVPNLPKMIALGQVPNALMQAAIQFAKQPKITQELIQEQFEFTRYLICETVKVPHITPDDVDQIPYEDQEMLMQFATRERDMDALGNHMAGLEKIESFRRVRRLPDLDNDLDRL